MLRRMFLASGSAAVVCACTSSPANDQSARDAEARYPPIGHLIPVDGLTVHATDQGTGGLPVILIHGASVNLRDWTFSLSERLARQRRVVAMDRPGFGYSSRDNGNWPPARQARQLRLAAHEIGIRHAIVVGHSWGAMVALAWALDAPDEVAGVVTVSGVTMPWGIGVEILSALGIGKLAVDWYMSSLARNASDGAVESFAYRAFRPQTPPAGYLEYVGAPLSLRASTMAANTADLSHVQDALTGLSDRYPRLAVPVEIVHGDHDRLLDVNQHAMAFAERLPIANVQIAQGVGHMAHHARPDLLEIAIDRIASPVVMT